MAHFEKVPERPSFDITDDYGHCANLTAEQAYELLQWLYEQRDILDTLTHGDKTATGDMEQEYKCVYPGCRH